MSIVLGIDLGSTSIAAIAVKADDDQAITIASSSAPNDAEVTTASDRLMGRSEWNLERMAVRAAETASDLVSKIDAREIAGIGITGQQQGCQLLDDAGNALGPFIAWQDQRCKDPFPDADGTFLDAMAERGGAIRRGAGLPSFQNAGCPIVTGYTAPTLFWLNYMNAVTANAAAAITGPEFLAHKLVGSRRPVTDATDAAGWGVLDVPNRRWNVDLVRSIGIDASLLAEIRDSCTIAGGLASRFSDIIGLPKGIPVSVPSGDHQCAFVGAVADANDTVAVNIGTGGQASVYLDDLDGLRCDPISGNVDHGWLELRPHVASGYLLAGVGVVGGRTFRALKDFFVRTAHTVFNLEDVDEDAVYERLANLAETELTSHASDAMVADALFTGTREKPSARGEFRNVTPGNFTPGAMTLAVFRSMATELSNSYRSAVDLGAGHRDRVVGSGNGLRLNPTLRKCIEDAFESEISIGEIREEAAVGAALTAAVAIDVYPDIATASRALVR